MWFMEHHATRVVSRGRCQRCRFGGSGGQTYTFLLRTGQEPDLPATVATQHCRYKVFV